MSEGKRVRGTAFNREIKQGLCLILEVLTEDFDNGFEQLFPEATEEQILTICAAMSWLNERTNWEIYG